MKTPLDPRHHRRQKIIQELFAWEAQRKIKDKRYETKEKDEKIIEIIKNIGKIDKLIAEAAPEWEISRINNTDLAILRLATYELAFEHTEPPKAIIDEAVELAKEFGQESSPAFINGALAKVLKSPARAIKIMADRLGVEEEKLQPEAQFSADLNITDLEVADLLSALEKDLAITIPEKKRFTTVREILDYLEDHNLE